MKTEIVYVAAFVVVFVVYTVTVIVLLLSMVRRRKLHKQEMTTVTQELESAEVYLKYQQMKPHFIYNTLNSVFMLIPEEPERAQRMIYKLSRYLKSNVDMSEQGKLIAFEQEKQYLEDYVDIMREKMPWLQLEFDLEETDFVMPPFVLQPIMENSIYHGFLGEQNNGRVLVSTRRAGNRVVITMEDNGCGSEEESVHSGRGIALDNIRRRLELLLHGTLILEMNKGVGTKVIINMERVTV